MRRAQTYRAPGSPGWLAWAIQNNTAPPARLELEIEPEPDPPAVEPASDLGPLDPAVWTWQANIGMNSQAETAPAPPAVPIEPIREPIDLDDTPGPAPATLAWPDEEACRRVDWRCDGGWVTLADGNLWAVPVLDVGHLIVHPVLRDSVASLVTLEQLPSCDAGPSDPAIYAAWINEFAVRIGMVMAGLIGLNYEFPTVQIGASLIGGMHTDTWTEPICRAIADVRRDAVALCVARGVPVCWD